jgi:hypothetical protein
MNAQFCRSVPQLSTIDSQLSHVELAVDSQQFLATGLMARFLFVTMEIRAWSKELDGRAAGSRGQRGFRPAFLQEGIECMARSQRAGTRRIAQAWRAPMPDRLAGKA